MIEVTLVLDGKELDLLVPGRTTFDRLQRLIREGFASRDVALPADYSLALADKALVISGGDIIESFGVGNGDRLYVRRKN
ncbi:EsaB/YukD family protein [Leifsonia sp. AG29]|uniref:EsaB/YukD family protein n=1 Tax=Leifsonia sp. AG29 TaxID=2598860 RepID=UPI00131AF5EE|nr:EsaB/YukD family protein [Leifsonia sp. AG29]